MLGHHSIYRVGKDDIGLAGGKTRLDQFLEQAARIDGRADFAGLGAFQVETGAIANRFHEVIGQQHAVMQVQRLAVEIAAGLADFQEFLDFGMRDIEIARRRTAPQRPLAEIARVRLSITRTNGMMPLVLPLSPTGSPMPRTLPQ